MAQQIEGRRAVVQDPLRQQAAQGVQSAQLPVGLVRGPDRPNMSGFSAETEQLNRVMTGLAGLANDLFEREMDTAITDGKVAYMSGVTEQELMKNGNRYTQMGYLQLKSRNDVNNWYLQEQADLVEKSNSMAPEDYQKYLSEKRAGFLDTIKDPYARKVAVAAFEQLNPDLASKQFTQNNAYNYDQRKQEVREYFRSGVLASPTSGRVIPGETSLTIQPQAVEPVMQVSARDRDLAIRTLVVEAGNQGETGMAAVVHNFRNRAIDSRYPDSIGGVVLQKGQYSGIKLHASEFAALKPGQASYDKAARVFDAVMSGRHIDPTGGALFYHSQAGMKAYAARGVAVSQSTKNRLAAAEADPSSIQIGGHLFYGKSDRARAGLRDMVEPVEQGDTSGDETTYRDPMVSSDEGRKARGEVDMIPVTKGTLSADTTDELNEAPAQEGVSGITEAGAPNEIIDFIKNYKGIKQEDMVDILSEEMASAFLSGSDMLFENAGGIAGLKQLGATAAQIDKVVRARERFQDEQAKQYNADDLKFKDDMLRYADQPDATWEEADKRIKEHYKSSSALDTQGRALASEVLTAMRNADKKESTDAKTEAEKNARYERWSNPEFLTEIGNANQRILDNKLDFNGAAPIVQEIADRYGMDPQDVAKMMGDVYEKDQQRQNGLRTEAQQRLKATQESEAGKREVQAALGLGRGGSDLTGNVKITNSDGTTSSITKKDLLIKTIKQDGMMQNPDNPAAVIAYVFPKLQAHDLIDDETKSQMTAALSGPITVKKDGKVQLTAEATRAYDTYAQLRQNNTITGDFIKKQVGNDYVRNLLELAYSFDSGNLIGEEALIRAKDMIDSKEIDPAYKNTSDKELDKIMEGAGEQFVRDKLAGSWSDWLNTTGEAIDNGIMFDAQTMQNALRTRALRHRDLYSWQTPEAALELAKQDLLNDTKRVAGNIVITPNDLHKASNLESPEVLDKAMSYYLAEQASTLFGAETADRWKPMAVNPLTPGRVPYGLGNPPPVKLMWLEGLGQYMAWPVGENGQVDLSRRAIIDPKKVGESWTEYRNTEGVGAKFKRMFDKNIVQKWKSDSEERAKDREQNPDGNGRGLKDGFGLFPALANSVKEFRENAQETDRSFGTETQGRPAY